MTFTKEMGMAFFRCKTALVLLTLLAASMASAQSRGGLFVEPMLTLESSDSKIKTSTWPGFTDTSGKMEGFGLGLRLGGHFADVLFLAADLRYDRSTFKDSSYGKATSPGYNYGLTFGGQTPFLGVRVWGTGIFGGEVDPESGDNGLDVKFQDGRGYRVGAGLHIAVVALSLEYQEIKYGKTVLQKAPIVGGINEASDVDFERKGVVLSLSFPVEL